jgi:hypothetical protein
MFLAREDNKSKTYLQLMSFIQMTKTTTIYILHENKECMVLHNTLLHNIIILIIFNPPPPQQTQPRFKAPPLLSSEKF